MGDRMAIRNAKLSELKTDPSNANKGTVRGLKVLDDSLRQYGAGRSILLDKAGTIIAGNKTAERAADIGMQDVIIVESDGSKIIAVQRTDLDLNDPDGRARALATYDNRVGQLDLDWDIDQLKMLDTSVLNNLWDPSELDDLGLGIEKPDDPGPDFDHGDELQAQYGTALGQLWALGDHRLIIGDCTDPGVVDQVMDGKMAAMCFTSPPYWVGKEYETQKSVAEIDQFIAMVCDQLVRAVRMDQSRIVINTGTGFTTSFDHKKKRHLLLLIDKWSNAMQVRGWNLRHLRHWLKEGQTTAIAPATDIIDQHSEFIGTFENDQGMDLEFGDWFVNNMGMLETFYNPNGSNRGQNRVYSGKRWALRAFWLDIHGTANKDDQGASFPLELAERHLALYARQGEIVYEPFAGSGTMIIGCERFKMKCRAIELDPKYSAIAIDRWHQMTKQDPIKVQ